MCGNYTGGVTPSNGVSGTSEAIELVELLREVNRGIRARVREALGAASVPPGQLRMLQILGQADNALRLVDVAHALGIAQRSVTTKVDDAIAAGLIEKRPDANDGRVTRVMLTDRGREVLDLARQARAMQADELLAELSPTERQELIRLLGEVARGVRS